MSKATVKITNLTQLIKKLGDISGIKLSQPIELIAEKTRGTAVELAPKKTTFLSRSITRKPLDDSYEKGAVIYTNIEYAPYQEFGTRRMKAQPFMKPAAIQNEVGNKKIITDYINKELKQIVK